MNDDLAIPHFLDRTAGMTRTEIDALRLRLVRRGRSSARKLKSPSKRGSRNAKGLGMPTIGFKVGRGQ